MTDAEIAALTATQLDALIARLIASREKCAPEVPQDPPNPCTALLDPKWHTFPDLNLGTSVLQLRHPGAGWLSFAIPRTETARLLALLAMQQQLAPHSPSHDQAS